MLPRGTDLHAHRVLLEVAARRNAIQWCLLGLLNSLVANYLVRFK